MADTFVPELTSAELEALRALVRIYMGRRITGPGVTFAPDGITINPPAAPVAAGRPPPKIALVRATAAVAGATHRYNGKVIPVNATATPGAALTVSDLGALPAADDCEIWNLAEFEADPLVLGLLVGVTNANKPIYIAANRGTQDFRYNATTFNLQTSHRLVRSADADWQNRVAFDPCPTGLARPGGSQSKLFATGGQQEGGFDDSGVLYKDAIVQLASINKNTIEISTADTTTTGTGAKIVITAGANGGTIYRVKAKAAGATQNGIIRLFSEPGGASTFTADAVTDVITVTDRGMADLTLVRLTTTLADLPAPLATGTDYWVIRLTGTTFKLAASEADAKAGTPIDITDAGTGTHTITPEKLWIGSIEVPETNPKPWEDSWEGQWTADDPDNGEPLDPYEKIYATTYMADAFTVRAFAFDL